MIKKTISGFTLIELLMVISIITLISSMFFSYVGSASAKSRDSVRLSDMKQINTAATMYYEDKGDVPDSIATLVETGYLSAIPVDPKTKESYTYKTGVVNGKKVFTAKAKYEKVYTTNSAGEEIPQQVGVIVGDIDLSQICSIVSEFGAIFGTSTEAFPTCDSSNTSNDQIIGYSSGHRSGGSGNTVVGNNVSDCSLSNISRSCPSQITTYNCYCENTIKNISNLSYEQCNSGYGLYWDGSVCFDQISCESALRVWSNGVCNPIAISYSNCSIEEIYEQCVDFPPYPVPVPPNLVNCYCNGTLNNINPEVLSQNECKVEYGLYWDTFFIGSEKCLNQITCEEAGRGWFDGICNPPTVDGKVYSDCSIDQISLLCPDNPELLDNCYCDGQYWE